jgi:hypothetical protein
MIPRRFHAIDRVARLAAPAALALALLSPGVFASPCDDDKDQYTKLVFNDDEGRTASDLQQMHEGAPRGVWKIDGGENGSVNIRSWDGEGVAICAYISAWTRSDQGHPEEIVRKVRIESDGRTLRAEGPEQSDNARWAVVFRIFAPRRIDLDVQAQNGGIGLNGIQGRMNLRTVNGPIAVNDVGGAIRGRSSNGPVSARLTGSSWKGEGLDLETSNGPVELILPKGFSAELETGTQNGPMELGFPVSMQEGHGSRITTTLGSGGPPVRVVTTNGPASIERR